jgi:hypothetical protein
VIRSKVLIQGTCPNYSTGLLIYGHKGDGTAKENSIAILLKAKPLVVRIIIDFY